MSYERCTATSNFYAFLDEKDYLTIYPSKDIGQGVLQLNERDAKHLQEILHRFLTDEKRINDPNYKPQELEPKEVRDQIAFEELSNLGLKKKL